MQLLADKLYNTLSNSWLQNCENKLMPSLGKHTPSSYKNTSSFEKKHKMKAESRKDDHADHSKAIQQDTIVS